MTGYRRSYRPGQYRQRGALSVGVVVMLLLLIGAALLNVFRLSGSGLQDAVRNNDQLAALFLAESGAQRARALLSRVMTEGEMPMACTSLGGDGDLPLGRGFFRYEAPVSGTCASPVGTVCRTCSFDVEGQAGDARRRLRVGFDITRPEVGPELGEVIRHSWAEPIQ
jgi:hypothetical protein